MTVNKKVSFQELFPLICHKIEEGGTFTFCAFGVSMLPYIRNGKDFVTLGPVNAPLKKNDIVFYRRKNGQFVLHRIVKIKNDEEIYLCGDNQYWIEKDISPQQILAKLVKLERDGREIPLSSMRSSLWCFFLPVRRVLLHIFAPVKTQLKRLFK